MMETTKSSIRTLSCVLLGTVLAAGCSGAREDVRISFCKQLVMTQVDDPGTVRWNQVKTNPQRYSGLSVVLGFEADGNEHPRQAVCHYRYNAVEDTALMLSDPLSAYATSPETMTIDGEPLPRPVLAKAVKAAMIQQGKAFIDRMR